MKKRLFGILTFLGIGLSFCSAQSYYDSNNIYSVGLASFIRPDSTYTVDSDYNCFTVVSSACRGEDKISILNPGKVDYEYLHISSSSEPIVCGLSNGSILKNNTSSNCFINLYKLPLSCPTPEPSSINVLYNNENSIETITCNGDNVIQIDGLSTITATNKFTPYFNIDYRDEDNQSLIESYSKNILYLSGGLFKKTFTGDNERILTSQGNNNSDSFSGYVATFDVVFTGDIFNDTGNVFNNFAQNSLQVALSNIPSYIQYVIIIMLLFFILGLARRKKRR